MVPPDREKEQKSGKIVKTKERVTVSETLKKYAETAKRLAYLKHRSKLLKNSLNEILTARQALQPNKSETKNLSTQGNEQTPGKGNPV